jgi:hypothetical protein
MSVLSGLCYKRIKDNFWYAKYDDFDLVVDRDDSFVNITKLCCDNGKSFVNLLNDEYYAEYIDKMIHALTGEDGTPPFKTIQCSGHRGPTISGVYYHPDILPGILGWISPRFTIKMNRIVMNELGCYSM